MRSLQASQLQKKPDTARVPAITVTRADWKRLLAYNRRDRREDDWAFVFSSGPFQGRGQAPVYLQEPGGKKRRLPNDRLLQEIAGILLQTRPQGGVIFLNFAGAHYFDGGRRPRFLKFK